MKKTFQLASLSLLIFLGLAGCSFVDGILGRRGEDSEGPHFSIEVPSIPGSIGDWLADFIENDDEEPIIYTDYLAQGGEWELPITGSTGFAAVNLQLRQQPDTGAGVVATLSAGQAFTIVREEGNWWFVEVLLEGVNQRGWVVSRYCMINLPDIIPSIIYYNTNVFSSLFRSSGYEVPNVTARWLYEGRDFNYRLGREEFIMPVMYGMAPKIFQAQQMAISRGHTLIIYEAFRPHYAHVLVHRNFLHLVHTNPAVLAGVNYGPFSSGWFLAPSPYNHQRGTAIDVSLGKIEEVEIRVTGGFEYKHITQFTEFEMQTPMHELSVESALFITTPNPHNQTAWMSASFAPNVTNGTIQLVMYMAAAGLTPLASEWWHFNDIPTTDLAISAGVLGQFSIAQSFSRPPDFE